MTEQWWSDDTVLRVAKALALSDLSSTAIPFGELSSRAQAAHLNAARVALAAVSSPQGVSCFLCGAGPNPDAVVWHSVFPGMVICRGCRDAKDMAANRPHARAEAFEEAKRIVRVQLGANQQALASLAGSEVGAIRLVGQRLRALEDVLAALDRAMRGNAEHTPEAT